MPNLWRSLQSKVKCLQIVPDRGESLKLLTADQSFTQVTALIGGGPVMEVDISGCFLCL